MVGNRISLCTFRGSAKIGTALDNRSATGTTWRRQQSRHLMQTHFSRQSSSPHQIACTGHLVKRFTNFLSRGITKQIINPVKNKFLTKSLPSLMPNNHTNTRSRTPSARLTPELKSEKVRVMRLNDVPLEFEYPPMAASLIMEYPDHVLVHCSTMSTRWKKYKSLKHRPNVTIVSGIKELVAGQKYYLLAVPSALKKLDKPLSSSYHGRIHRCSLGNGEAAPSVLQVGRGRRKKIMLSAVAQGEVETILDSAPGGASTELQKIKSSSKVSVWTPALGSIPESPQPKAPVLCSDVDTTAESELLAYVRASITTKI